MGQYFPSNTIDWLKPVPQDKAPEYKPTWKWFEWFKNIRGAIPPVKQVYFTPNILGGTTAGTTTYASTRTGVATRIGNLVHFSLSVEWTNQTGTGDLHISGLPYSNDISTTTGNLHPVFPVAAEQFTFPASTEYVVAYMNTADNVIQLAAIRTGTTLVDVQINTTGTLHIAGTYLTNDPF